jgi:hypothetical protein
MGLIEEFKLSIDRNEVSPFIKYANSDIYVIPNTSNRFLHYTGGAHTNIKDQSGILKRFDPSLKIITGDHPLKDYCKYLCTQGPAYYGFHDLRDGKYGVLLQLYSGERIIKKIQTANPVVTPTLISGGIEWRYANGSYIREYSTPKGIKEVMFQKAGQNFTIRYTLTGFTPSVVNGQVLFTPANLDNTVYVEKPFYMDSEGEFLSYVNITIQNQGNGVYDITYPAPASDCFIDPTLTIGNATGDDVKDTYIDASNKARGRGSAVTLGVRGSNGFIITLERFPLTGIPANATLNSSTLYQYLSVTDTTGTIVAKIHRMLTNWGKTYGDAGLTSSGVTDGSATYRASFDFNLGGGHTAWASGDISASDYAASTLSFTVRSTDAAGTEYATDIKTIVDPQRAGNNYGIVLIGQNTGSDSFSLHSEESATAEYRPKLVNDYTLPSSSSSSSSSKSRSSSSSSSSSSSNSSSSSSNRSSSNSSSSTSSSSTSSSSSSSSSSSTSSSSTSSSATNSIASCGLSLSLRIGL